MTDLKSKDRLFFSCEMWYNLKRIILDKKN